MGALVVDSIGSGLFIPLALIYFVEMTEVSQITVGVILSAAGVLALPLPALAGYLADRFGALPLIIGSHCLQAAGFVGYGFATQPVAILLTVLLTTAGVRIFWSTIFTAVADFADGSSSPMTKDMWFAWVNTFRLSGFGTGMLVSGIAVSVGGDVAYLAISWSTSVCYLVSAVALAVFVRIPRRVAGAQDVVVGYRSMLRDRPFLGFTSVNVLFAMSSRMLALGLPSMVLYDLHGPGWVTSTVLVGNTVLLAVLSTPITRLLRRFRRTRVIVLAGFLWAVWSFAFASIPRGDSVWLLLLLVGGSALLFTVAEVMYGPASMALVNDIAPTAARGRYLAAFQYSFVASGIVCPVFFTTLFAVRPELPWLVLGLVNLCAVTGMYFFELSVRRERTPSMTTLHTGFKLVDLPAVAPALLDSYANLPVDDYMGGGTRFKRFSQYRLSPVGQEDWRFDLLPHRAYTAFKEFNPVGGGMRREYLPVEVDFTPLIAVGVAALGLDRAESWQLNVHQNRTVADAGTPGPLTPEGVHHDGHEFVMIAVLRRHNVGGALTRLWKPGATEPFWTGTLGDGQAVLLDDKSIAHDVTDVVSADGGRGHRDIVIVAFSRWREKWYGDDHDAAALAGAPATAGSGNGHGKG
jgi:hypothetical protein